MKKHYLIIVVGGGNAGVSMEHVYFEKIYTAMVVLESNSARQNVNE